MSQRSRANRYQTPGSRPDRPSREVRRLERQAERRAEHQALHEALGGDFDDMVIPERRHGGIDADPARTVAAPSRKRFKVWKTKMWKRRSQQRRDKAAAEAALRDAA